MNIEDFLVKRPDGDFSVDSQSIFPKVNEEDKPFCPFVNALIIPVQGRPKMKFLTMLHPCVPQCALWSTKESKCKVGNQEA